MNRGRSRREKIVRVPLEREISKSKTISIDLQSIDKNLFWKKNTKRQLFNVIFLWLQIYDGVNIGTRRSET